MGTNKTVGRTTTKIEKAEAAAKLKLVSEGPVEQKKKEDEFPSETGLDNKRAKRLLSIELFEFDGLYSLAMSHENDTASLSEELVNLKEIMSAISVEVKSVL